MSRTLTRNERIQARHFLQVLMENARTVRNAMDPVSGVMNITDVAWEAQWSALTADLDAFTKQVMP